MEFNRWKSKDEFELRNGEIVTLAAQRGWEAAVKHHLPRIYWDEYAKSYVIELKDGTTKYWNP